MEHVPATDALDLALARELHRAERILWQGRPLRRVQLGHFGIWLFAVPWTAFAAAWMTFATAGAQASQEGEFAVVSWVFPLFGVPFVLVGLGLMAIPLCPLYGARRTIFAVTDSRMIRLRLGRTLNSETVAAERVGTINRVEKSDGSGTLKIATGVGRDSDGDPKIETFSIGEVSNVMEAEQAVRKMIERAPRPAAA